MKMQGLENIHFRLQSHYRHIVEKKDMDETLTWVTHTTGSHATNWGTTKDMRERALIRLNKS
jgi:hypothetical protein